MGKYRAPGEDEYQGKEFALLPEDDYLVEIKNIEEKTEINPFSKTEENPDGEMRTQLKLQLNVISFADGAELVDVEGGSVPDDRRFTDFIDPTKTGLRPQPSKARQLFAALTGTPIGQPIDVPDESEWVGQRVVVSMRHNKGRHKVVGYKAARRQRPAPKPAMAASLPGETRAKAEPAEDAVMAAARETFGDLASGAEF